MRQLNAKIEEAKRRKNLLVARQKRAEAQKTIQETMSGLNDTSAFDTFDRMSEKIEQMEAEAEASADLAESMTGDDLSSQFENLEQDHGADEALMALKAKMGVAREKKEEKFQFEEQKQEQKATVPAGRGTWDTEDF